MEHITCYNMYIYTFIKGLKPMINWYQLAHDKEKTMIQIRRHLHQYPELSFEESHTHDYIVNQLEQLSCEIRRPVGKNGIVATFKGQGDGPTIALRADFDALPITELNDKPYLTVLRMKDVCMRAVMTATLLFF